MFVHRQFVQTDRREEKMGTISKQIGNGISIEIDDRSTKEEIDRAIGVVVFNHGHFDQENAASNIGVLKELLDMSGSNPDSITIDLELCGVLYWAALKGWTEAVELFLDRGASVDLVSVAGKTALHGAAYTGYVDVCRILIDRGAGVGLTNRNGQTALHLAARWGHTDVARLLLDSGAEVDAASATDKTPLCEAMLNFDELSPALEAKRIDFARLLILRGADCSKAFKGPREIMDFFEGDIDWWPEGPLKSQLKRMQRGKQAFGM